MKRIAISLGSISLFVVNTGYCEPVEAVTSSLATEIPSTANSEELEEDEFAFLETDPSELEEELLSLEKELAEQEESASMAELHQEKTTEAVDTAARTEESITPQENTLQKTASSAPADLADQETKILEEKSAVQAETLEGTTLSTSQTPVVSPFSEMLEDADELEDDALTTEVAVTEEAQASNTEEVQASNEVLADSDAVVMEKELSSSLAPITEVEVAKVEEPKEVPTPVNEVAQQEVAAVIAPAAPSTTAVFRSPSSKMEISFGQVFSGSPLIYGMLLLLSIASVVIWLYNTLTLRINAGVPDAVLKNVRNKLVSNHYDEALSVCRDESNFFCKMMASGISSRKYGLQFMLESMKSEGKRASVSFWQRLSLLQDIAIVAPMLGLLGTVLGMFYAFYDLNRSFESISTLFDGLGISVGTTVAGIFVAILAMVLHSMSKFRLVKALSRVENEALTLAHLIDHKTHG